MKPTGSTQRSSWGWRSIIGFFTLLMAWSVSVQAEPSKLAVSGKGIIIKTAAGDFLLPVPSLISGDLDYVGEKAALEISGDAVLGKYPSGAAVTLKLGSEPGTIHCEYSGAPAKASGLRFETFLPINFNQGGLFALGDKPLEPFPATKDKQIIRDGWAQSFTALSPMGEGYRLTLPGEYQQLQDNRVFEWPVFVHIFTYLFKNAPTQGAFDLKVEAVAQAAPAAGPAFLVDRYGQNARVDFAGKVRSDDELKADVVSQAAALQQPRSISLDLYGGLAESSAKLGLKKTGFFHLEQASGREVLVDPAGNLFFHLGVCGIALTDDYTLVAGREKTYEWLPPHEGDLAGAWRPDAPGIVSFYIANWVRKFGRPFSLEEWTTQVIDRLRAWGFNSGGAFSISTKSMATQNFPHVGSLPINTSDGVIMLPDKIGASQIMDPFAPGNEATLDKAFAAQIAPHANDPLLIGYFQGNEQHFELLPRLIPSYKASEVRAKARLVEFLRQKYGSVEAFQTAWQQPQAFASWEALGEAPLFVKTESASADMGEFFRLFLETYYAMVTRLFRQHDPHHLLLGNRHTPATANNEDVVRIGGKYLDVMSVNYYTYPIEPGFLQQVHTWSGRPIILSEWYYSSTDSGLGAGKEVKDQKERALAYRNYVEQAAALPFVVGSEWFIFNDQALTGRFFEGFNGEGNNTGLVTVADRPYPDLVAATRQTGDRIYDVLLGKTKPFAFDDPRFQAKASGGNRTVSVPRALPGLKLDGSTTNWPGRPAEPIESSRLVLGNANPRLRGDFRLCWDETSLHFLIQVKDPTPGHNDAAPAQLWSADGVELFLGVGQPNQKGSMLFSDRQILLGAGREPKVFVVGHEEESRACRLVVVPDVTGDGYTLQVSIPWKILGVTPRAGTELLFDVAIDNSDDGHERRQQLMWNGSAQNSGDRGSWGHARLVDN